MVMAESSLSKIETPENIMSSVIKKKENEDSLLLPKIIIQTSERHPD
jgi:hypothetical protein